MASLLLVGALTATLPVAALHRLTTEKTAVTLATHIIAQAFSRQGLDDPADIERARAMLRGGKSQTLSLVPGLTTAATYEDTINLTPREFRYKIIRQITEPLYHQGVDGLAAQYATSPEQRRKFITDAALLRPFTAPAHRFIGTILLVAGSLVALFLLLVILFSHRVGKLVTPGLILLLTGLPGVLFWLIKQAQGTAELLTAPATLPAPNEYGELARYHLANIVPLIIDDVMLPYLATLILGLALLGSAGITCLILRFRYASATDSKFRKASEPE
jgi:hypothetical protein